MGDEWCIHSYRRRLVRSASGSPPHLAKHSLSLPTIRVANARSISFYAGSFLSCITSLGEKLKSCCNEVKWENNVYSQVKIYFNRKQHCKKLVIFRKIKISIKFCSANCRHAICPLEMIPIWVIFGQLKIGHIWVKLYWPLCCVVG